MIEVVYKESADGTEEQKVIQKPKNIRQIGSGSSKFKIYVEDYVLSYIKRGPRQENEVKYGLLLGELKRGEGNTYLFIRGAAEATGQSEQLGWNEEIWSSLYEDVHKYFEKWQVLGWFASLPFANDTVYAELNRMQYSHFAGADKVLFLIDRTENEDKFMRHNGILLQEIEGYYVFFERNEEMQIYMAEKGTAIVGKDKEKKTRHGALLERMKWQKRIPAASLLITAALLALVLLMNNYGELRKINKALTEQSGKVTIEYKDDEDDDALPVGGSVTDKETAPQNGDEEGSTTGDNANGDNSGDTITQTGRLPIRYYIVQPGETLYQICLDIYKSAAMVEIVRELNGIGEDYVIHEGQKIILP